MKSSYCECMVKAGARISLGRVDFMDYCATGERVSFLLAARKLLVVLLSW